MRDFLIASIWSNRPTCAPSIDMFFPPSWDPKNATSGSGIVRKTMGLWKRKTDTRKWDDWGLNFDIVWPFDPELRVQKYYARLKNHRRHPHLETTRMTQEHMSTAGVTCLYAEIGRSGTGGQGCKRNAEALVEVRHVWDLDDSRILENHQPEETLDSWDRQNHPKWGSWIIVAWGLHLSILTWNRNLSLEISAQPNGHFKEAWWQQGEIAQCAQFASFLMLELMLDAHFDGSNPTITSINTQLHCPDPSMAECFLAGAMVFPGGFHFSTKKHHSNYIQLLAN